MNGFPTEAGGSLPDPFENVVRDVQEELDRHAAMRRATGLGVRPPRSVATISQTHNEWGAFMGALLGPLVYSLLVLTLHITLAPWMLQDDNYRLLHLSTIPYSIMWGAYMGARVSSLFHSRPHRYAPACLLLAICVAAMLLIAVSSPGARMYFPMYGVPLFSILWVEILARHENHF